MNIANIVAIQPTHTNISNWPPSNMKPNTADSTIEPDVARVFNIASAYLSVAATNKPPAIQYID